MSKSRIAVAVTAGALFWAVLWVGGGVVAQQLWPRIIIPGQRIERVSALLCFILFSVVLSIAAGLIAASVEREGTTSVRILAALQFVVGLVFEITAWHATPVWYHVVFLALIIPATLFGGITVPRYQRRHISQAARCILFMALRVASLPIALWV